METKGNPRFRTKTTSRESDKFIYPMRHGNSGQNNEDLLIFHESQQSILSNQESSYQGGNLDEMPEFLEERLKVVRKVEESKDLDLDDTTVKSSLNHPFSSAFQIETMEKIAEKRAIKINAEFAYESDQSFREQKMKKKQSRKQTKYIKKQEAEVEKEKNKRKTKVITQEKFKKLVKRKALVARTLFELKEQSSRKKSGKLKGEVLFEDMNPEERKQKIANLWVLTAQRAFLMGSIVRIFKHVNEKVQQFGTSRRVQIKEKSEKENISKGCVRVSFIKLR